MATIPSCLLRHQDLLTDLNRRDRYRQLKAQTGIDFASNDYLGLANDPQMRAVVNRAVEDGIPVGAGASRLLRGNHPEHQALEQEAASFFGAESALFFSTGFSANVTLFGTLPQRGDLVILDELVHASAHDGVRLGRAETALARHNDVDDFADIARRWRGRGGRGRIWFAVETLYSMDGDVAPVDALIQLADANDAFLIVDEAHATGVFGDDGRGLAASLQGRDNVISLHTCGKALGAEGAFLCGSVTIMDFLVNYGRGFIFSTAPSPLMANVVRASLRILKSEPERRIALHALVSQARARLSPYTQSFSETQIIPIIIGDDAHTMAVADTVQAAGYDVRGIRPPTVPSGTSRLRVSVTLNATSADIQGLAETLDHVL